MIEHSGAGPPYYIHRGRASIRFDRLFACQQDYCSAMVLHPDLVVRESEELAKMSG
jgi:hypothetical protein